MTSLVLLFVLIVAANATSVERRFGGRIIGGIDTNIEDHPYQVSIQLSSGHFCGGSIISNRHVLTAAHCVHLATSDLYVRSGTSYKLTDGLFHKVTKNVTKKLWKLGEDVAVLTVDPPFEFDKTRMPIRLSSERPAVGTVGNITGWGRIMPENSEGSNRLQVTQVPIISNDECSKAYKNTTIAKIAKTEMCAGHLAVGGKDSCQGDSGGPLVVNNVQVGIISLGKGCADAKYPGIYADVAHFKQWIEEKAYLN